MELVHEGARQRWKIENETFNTLKNHGMELQHSYGNKGYCLQNYFLVRFIALSIEQFLTFSNGLIKILSPNTILPSRERVSLCSDRSSRWLNVCSNPYGMISLKQSTFPMCGSAYFQVDFFNRKFLPK